MTNRGSSIPATLRVVCFTLAMLLSTGFCLAKTTISLSSTIGPPTTKVQVSGSGFTASVKIDIYFDSRDVGLATANGSGSFSKVTISVPTMAQPGNHTVKAVARQGTASAKATFLVRTDWNQFHFDNMQRRNPYENVLNVNNVSGLHEKATYSYWREDDYVTYPLVANGVLYISNYDGSGIYALTASTGDLLWKYSLEGVVYGPFPFAVKDGTVYATYDKLYAIDAANGALLWSVAGEGNVPTVANGVVYVGRLDGNVYAHDAGTGAILWSYTAGGDVGYSIPAVANGTLYVGSDDHNLYALNASTGALQWKYVTGDSVWSSPAVANGVVYVGSNDGNLYALNGSTGALNWKYSTGGAIWDASPAVANGIVYISSSDTNLYALNASTGTLQWIYATGCLAGIGGIGYCSPAVANGVVYVCGGGGTLYALNAKTGAELWSSPIVSPHGPTVVADGIVYVATDHADIEVFGLK
jgi:outer membrane protein assembly factor BamB